MPDNFFSGFAEGFSNARRNRTLKDTLRLEQAQEAEKARRQEQQFNQEMDFRERQAQSLEHYRAESLRIDQEAKEKLAINQQKQMDLNITKEFMTLADPALPAPVRKLGFKKLVQNLGIDPNSQDAKDAIAAFGSLDSEALEGIRTGLALALPQAQPGEITAMAQGVLSGKVSFADLYKMANDAKIAQRRQEIFGGPPQTAPDDGGEQTGTPARQMTPEEAWDKALQAIQNGDDAAADKLMRYAEGVQGAGDQGTMGQIPSGYEAYTDPSGRRALRPMMGSPAEAEQKAAQDKETGSRRDMQSSGGLMIQELGRSRLMLTDLMEKWPTGPLAGAQIAARRRNPQDPIYQLDQTLSTVKAKVSADSIQQMRANSPTGAALGGVSDKDLELLERTKGNLDVNQDPQVLLDNLNRLDNMTRDLVWGTPEQIDEFVAQGKLTEAEGYRYSRRHKLSFDEFGEPVKKPVTKEEFDKLPSGAEFLAPDGKMRRKP